MATAASAVRRATRDKVDRHTVRLDSSAVLAVEQILHRLATSRVRSLVCLQNIRRLRLRFSLFFAARGTPVGEARLPGLQLEFLATNNAGFNRKCHALILGGRAALKGRVSSLNLKGFSP